MLMLYFFLSVRPALLKCKLRSARIVGASNKAEAGILGKNKKIKKSERGCPILPRRKCGMPGAHLRKFGVACTNQHVASSIQILDAGMTILTVCMFVCTW